MAVTKNRGEVERALGRADPAIRCYLLYGPDESGSRALAAKLAAGLGADAERIDLAAAQLKADPALLADEAASVSLFGGARHIRVEGAGDDCLAAVEALLDAPAAGNPVVLIGGALRKDAKIVKRLEGDAAALIFASWLPEGQEADRIAIEIGRAAGLRIDPDLARRLAQAAGGDRAVLAREVEKLALYADADPQAPKEATHAMVDAVGADAAEADLSRMIDALFSGDTAALDREFTRAAAEGLDAIPRIRAVLRRLQTVVPARTEMDRGAAPRAAIDKAARQLFWKEKDAVARDLPRWTSQRLAMAIDRCAAMERTLKSARGPGGVAADQLLLAMARSVRR
jgi:DNA polymerase III subunit delta